MPAAAAARRAAMPARPAAARRATKARATLQACHNGKHLSDGQKDALAKTAELVARPGKGITAVDEGPGTIGARFENVGVENSEEARRVYRQMLFTAGDGKTADHLSAAILDPETLYQSSDGGVKFPELLESMSIVPGVKPHLKVYALPGQDGATVMQGLDSLAARCREYYAAGARFAKWRSPIEIDVSNGQPSDLVIEANMKDLARYAIICQAEGLMPIVEPDVSLKGDHDLEQAVAINVKIQSALYHAMLEHGVFMEGTTLKPNIINPGKACTKSYTLEEIARANLDVLQRCFPTAMPGLNFLSGGQSLEDAAARLSYINKLKDKRHPWNISFSWSAALQMPLFELCRTNDGDLMKTLPAMEELYLEELAIASSAALGTYEPPAGSTDGAHVGVEAAVKVAA